MNSRSIQEMQPITKGVRWREMEREKERRKQRWRLGKKWREKRKKALRTLESEIRSIPDSGGDKTERDN